MNYTITDETGFSYAYAIDSGIANIIAQAFRRRQPNTNFIVQKVL